MKVIIALIAIFIFFPPNVKAEFLLGVGTHLFEQDINKNIEIMNKLGLNSFRDDYSWGAVEKEYGKLIAPAKLDAYLDNSKKSKISPLIILDYGNRFYDGGKKPVSIEAIAGFVRYAEYVAKHNVNRANIFEIWNEWDHSAEPVSAESYFKLVKAVAPAIKSINKHAVVLAGAATTAGIRKGWIEQLVKLGILKYVDGISIHPYIHCERDKSPEAWIKFVSETSAVLQKANGGKTVPLYITEMGWPSHNGACGTSPGTVSQYLAQTLLLVRTLPEVKGFWWYDLKNDGQKINEREHNFGLLNYDYSLKPAFSALSDIAEHVIHAKSVVRQSAPNGIVSLVITDNNGKKSFALWSEDGKNRILSLSIKHDRNLASSIIKVGTSKNMQIDKKNKVFSISLDGTPQIITGITEFQIDQGF